MTYFPAVAARFRLPAEPNMMNLVAPVSQLISMALVPAWVEPMPVRQKPTVRPPQRKV